jgi:glycosyltransferase involved in cell wall biosynthesis
MAIGPQSLGVEASNQPMVSVCLITYNHAPYIRQALDSVLAQEVHFPIEICLGEDESNDGTREICEEYAAKYPNCIRLFKRSRSTVEYKFGLPTGNYNFTETIKAAKGKYIALLEGDDYWIDPHKLAKQVTFLEANPDYSLAGHLWLNDRGAYWSFNAAMKFQAKEMEIDLGGFLEGLYMHTSTLVFRRPDQPTPDYYNQMFGRDHVTQVWMATLGRCAVLPWVGSAYRLHDSGSWNGLGFIKRLQVIAHENSVYCLKFPAYSDRVKYRRRKCTLSTFSLLLRW